MLDRKNNCLDDEKVKKKDTYIWIPAGLTLLVIIALVLFLGCIFLLWVDSNTSDILGGILLIFALGLIALFVKYGIFYF